MLKLRTMVQRRVLRAALPVLAAWTRQGQQATAAMTRAMTARAAREMTRVAVERPMAAVAAEGARTTVAAVAMALAAAMASPTEATVDGATAEVGRRMNLLH